jgi:hypothetical protein
MVIQGKSLELVKRALLSHLSYVALNSIGADEKTLRETWDPEYRETLMMIDAVDKTIVHDETISVLAGE